MKNNLKRVLSLAIALMLVLSCFAYAETETVTDENGNVFVVPTIVNEADLTIEEWLASDESRVLYVVSTIVDCSSVWTDDDLKLFSDALDLNTVYLANDEDVIYLLAFDEDSYMMYTYSPEGGFAFYGIEEFENASVLSALAMDILVEDGLFTAYYQVEAQDVIDKISEITAENAE